MKTRPLTLLAMLALTLARPAVAAEPPPDLTLEELLKADVKTASRKAERLQDVAAAVFVITREDIERSGVTSIPEALRLAPGVQVARLSNNRWAVTARGFNGRFANKLQVLMDGRSLYSPLFSGVLWEMEDTLLEDVDRIEVIRGPGASLWGANAVNGVINIITRSARETRGGLVVVGAGSSERAFGAVRQGFGLGDGHVRLWAKAFTRERTSGLDGSAGNDDWRDRRAGFRGDWSLASDRRLTVSGAVFSGPTGDRWNVADVTSPAGYTPLTLSQYSHGGHLLGRHEWIGSDGSEAVLQAYFDHSGVRVPGQVDDHRRTLDLDFQHRPRPAASHDLLWGLSYRESRDRIASGGIITIEPDSRRWRLASLFVQDEIALVPERFKTVLGIRLEHNSFTGWQPQPNARVAWTPTAGRTLWGAWSHAVRTPSRAELDAQVDLRAFPARDGLPPVLLRNEPRADRHLLAERVRAFELGWREQLGARLSVDLALFSNGYDRLRTIDTMGAAFAMQPVPHALQQVQPQSAGEATTRGLELALDWHPARNWRIQPAVTWLRMQTRAVGDDPAQVQALDAFEGVIPGHQVSVRSSLSLGAAGRFDAWLRHVGALRGSAPDFPRVPAYTTLDLRYAWQPGPNVEIALVGQNLLGPRHVEFVPDYLPSQTLAVRRSAYARLKWQF